MGTTIDAKVGRRGGAYSVEELENILNQARKILADTMAVLELENEKFLKAELKQDDKVHLDEVMKMVKLTQQTMQTVTAIEDKYGLSAMEARQHLDLEAARAEILERIRRLARRAA